MKNGILSKPLGAILLLTLGIGFWGHNLEGGRRVRTEIAVPDIGGYVTLKCDFHMHSVFSDGDVWPPVRVEEAWRQGLDGIALTEHIEYRPHKEDMVKNHNRAYELALPMAKALGIILVRGGEITRKMPPGHFNALFLTDAAALDKEDFRSAIAGAAKQGAFIFWNHPGWKGQQKDGIPRWYPIQSELLEKGMLHGIEIANWTETYPAVHRWCLDKKLTIIGNSDSHGLSHFEFDPGLGEHRPLTLVFAEERSEAAIKAALFARRTAVYFKHGLKGEKQYLEGIYNGSVQVLNPRVTLAGKKWAYVQIQNRSDIPYKLVLKSADPALKVPGEVTLYAQKTVLLEIAPGPDRPVGKKEIAPVYVVKNLEIAPGQGLVVPIPLQVDFGPADE